MATVSLLTTHQPHWVPGYTGYCPQYRYRCGETYGTATHKLLLDPAINHAKKLILSAATDCQVEKPAKSDLDTVNSRAKRDVVYKYPLVPGYEGFMPKLKDRPGQRYSIAAVEGLADFERQQLKRRAHLNTLKKVIALQDSLEPRNISDQRALKNKHKLPLVIVRPEYARMMRNLPVDDASCSWSEDHSSSPQAIRNSNPAKYHQACEYSGHISSGYEQFGAMTNSALCDFTSNYRMRQSTSATISSCPELPYQIQSTKIYHEHVGLIPNYRGHVPGASMRYGKTFGADSKDVKRWLKGDFIVQVSQ